MLKRLSRRHHQRSKTKDAVITMPTSEPSYPPRLSEQQLSTLIVNIRDWQFAHGSLLKAPPVSGNVSARPIGVTLFPSLYPKECFYEARSLQALYNELYAAVAEDEEWLYVVLKDLIRTDPLAKALWTIHEAVKEGGYVQEISLGLFRSDYMLHAGHSDQDGEPSAQLKQVEFNTFSCAGGTHSNKISEMHRFLQKSGTYDEVNHLIKPSSMPPSTTIASLVAGLTAAHKAYGEPKHEHASQTGVLFVVQPNNVNTCDERPLEYALWNQDHSVPAYRIEYGESVLTQTSLSPSHELLYYPPSHSANPVEISVVYMRAGYDPEEYEDIGSEVRLHLERSRAIKCPSILGHLSTFKKVQQALTVPGALQRFISADKASRIASTFVPLYPLDESEQGLHARKLALDPKTAVKYILKPSLEGGGHNVYRDKIPAFLKGMPQSQWGSYVLMEVINSPEYANVLLSPQGLYTGAVVSELGIFGVCLWRYRSGGGGGAEVLESYEGGYSFKTKRRDVDEMSVVKGFGCFDSPCLV